MLADLRAALAPCGPMRARGPRRRACSSGSSSTTRAPRCDLLLDLLDRGVLVNHSLNAHRVVRLTPPAVLTDAEADRVVEAVAAAATALAGRALERSA